MKNLLNNKFFLIAFGLIAIVGITYIGFTASQNASQTATSNQFSAFNPKVAKLSKPVQDKPVSGQIIVKFKTQYTDAQINAHLQQYHASIIKTIEGINQTVVKVPIGQESTIEQELKNDPYVETTQRDYTTHAFLSPNDPLFSLQYAFANTGQSILGQVGTPNVDIHAEQAWNTTEGNGVKVAILDTGINLNQPDLAGKVILQKSFVTGFNTVEDGNGHGTHVAGILAADTNNNVGVAGTCPGCQLLIGKVLDNTGAGTTSDATEGITWAADNGAKVISMSFGTNDPQSALLYNQAVSYAISKGAVVVAAAGNDGSTQLNYPAAAPGVVAVAAITNTDAKASYSNYGSWVQIAAPGDSILSTGPTHSFDLEPFGYNTSQPYYYLSGTSMSAPIVAGVAALIASTSYGTSPQAIINRLYATADKISGTGTYWTYGRVDAAAAVGTAPTATPALTSGVITPTLYCVGGSGVPPCATIPPNNPVSPSIATGNNNGTNPSVSPAPSGNNPVSGAVSPSVAVSGTPGTGNGSPSLSGPICTNLSQFLNNLVPNQTNTTSKVHIKCEPSKGGSGKKDKSGDGGNSGVNPNNGWLSRFIAFLIQLIMQLLQLCGVQTPTTGTPTISEVPSIVPSQSLSTAPTSGSSEGGGAAPTNTPVTSNSCTNPTHTIQIDTSNPHNGITLGNYFVDTDTWNYVSGMTQTVYVCNYNNWYVVAGNMAEAGGVKSYPNVHEDFNDSKAISAYKTITSTFASTSPRMGIYDAAYDIWLNNFGIEIMVWNESYNQTLDGLNPGGSKQTTVTLDGRTYDVYKNGSYIAFKATTPFDSGTINILDMFNWLTSQGWVSSSATLSQVDYGIEFVSTNNQNATFKLTNFSVTAN